MHRILATAFALAIATAWAVPAAAVPLAPAPLAVRWQANGSILALADLDGAPGLEIVNGGVVSGRIEILEPVGGAVAYQLPAKYADGQSASILIENFDGVGGAELMVWRRENTSATHFGMFGWNGAAYVPRWEVTDGMPVDAELTSVEIYGNGVRHVVAWWGQNLWIIDAMNGVVLYDLAAEHSQLSPGSVSAVDIDGDAIEELLVTAFDPSIQMNVILVIEPVQNVGTQPAATVGATLLGRNVPNPFRDSTRIRFTVPERGLVKLAIYDVTGRRVRRLVNGVRAAGPQELAWDGCDDRGRRLVSGSYFCEIEVDGARQTRRLVRLD